ncbi:MAG: T9SS type A sorting domain-containing protein [Candidatus Marinimicrobia bacterium]|nr:T9SS type A sorting domain-containing protein [Candidatus Neomarinimicrobiota bacterium]MCF7829797.1 T9SS type A sorting domain-containing protein [Candidatus Neomarinimicrobiota bacterium]MCF7881770.1 T9SS type A sorting domain-containing protein [Candidatus Neomarinimicrobiota bacterium]
MNKTRTYFTFAAALVFSLTMLTANNLFGQNAPELTQASYSAESHSITLTFGSQVYAEHSLLGLIEIDDDFGGQTPNIHLDTAQVVTEGVTNQVVIDLVSGGSVALLKDFESLDTGNLQIIAESGAFLAADSITYSDPVSLVDSVMVSYAEYSGRTSLESAAYDAYLNQVDLVFNRPVLVSMVGELSLTIGDGAGSVPFQGSVDIFQTSDNDTIQMDLNSRLAQAVEQLDLNSLVINGPKWAFVDTFYRAVPAIEGVGVAATPDTAASFNLNAARYNNQKNTLAMDFNRTVQFGTVIGNRVTFNAGGDSYLLKGNKSEQYRDSTATITLIREDQRNVENLLRGAAGFTVAVEAFTIQDQEDNGNNASEVPGTFVDTLNAGTPTVTDTVRYDAETNTLKVNFTQRMNTNIIYEGFHIVNSAANDTLTLNEPVEVNRENALQTLAITLGDRDAFTLESNSSADKSGSLHLVVDEFSAFDLVDGNGNLQVDVDDTLPLIYTADATAPNLVEFFYDMRNGVASFMFDKETALASELSSGDVEVGGVSVTGIDSVANPEPHSVALYVDSETEESLSLANLPVANQVDLSVSYGNGIFANLDGVAAQSQTDVTSGLLNAAGEEIAVGYGREFWVRSFEAFAPAPSLYPASIRGVGDKLRVYVSNAQWLEGNVTQQDVDTLIARFESEADSGIYNFVTTTYGLEPKDTDGDPFINVLFSDILDEYDLGRNDTNSDLYVHGFYTGQDTLMVQEYQYSNESDLIYLDCNPQTMTDGEFGTGLNAITNEFVKMVLIQNRPDQERWIREGLATMAEFGILDGEYSLYGGAINTPSQNQLTYIEGSLKTRSDEINAFAFHLYLYEKYGGFDLLGEIAQSDSVGIKAVSDALNTFGVTKTIEQVYGDYSVACFLDLPHENDVYNGLYSIENLALDNAPVNKNATPLNWSESSPGPYSQSGIQPWSFNFYANIAYSLDLQGNPVPKSPLLDADGQFQFNGRDDSQFSLNKVMLRSTYLEQMDPDFAVTPVDNSTEDGVGTVPVSEEGYVFDNGTADEPVTADESAGLAFLIVGKTDDAPAASTYDFVISNSTSPPSYADFLATQIPTNNRYLNLYVISEHRIYDGFGVEGPRVEIWSDADTLAGEVRNIQTIVMDKLFSQGQTSVVYQGAYEFTYDAEYTYDFRFFGQDLSGNSAGGESLEITAMKYDGQRAVSISIPDENGTMNLAGESAEETFLTATTLKTDVSFAPAKFVQPNAGEADKQVKTVSDPFFFGPVNLELHKPAEVSLAYDTNIEDPGKIGVYYLHKGAWEYIGGEIDPATNTIRTKTKNLGYFVLKSGAHPDTPEELQIPAKFALYQNYPNPFNPITQIKYGLAEETVVNISVYNLLGQRIATLVNKSQAAGYHRISWDATNDFGRKVSSGVYFIRIRTPEFTAHKKMVYLR